MGYAGGTSGSPTYRAMGDHTECFQVDFDPAVVAYEDLLELFWQSHDASRVAWKTQYASLVLTHDDEQLAVARDSAQRVSGFLGKSVATRIEPLGRFWLAEDYHQKYYLRSERALAAEFMSMFEADEDAFRESTAAMRVNAFLHGVPCARVERDLPSLGLSESGAQRLRAVCVR